MKMNYKRFGGLLGILLALSLVFIACDDGSGGDGSGGDGSGDGGKKEPDPTVTPIEAAFTNMLKANFFVSGSSITVNAITKMTNWGQTDSEYDGIGTKGRISYRLPSSFGTVTVTSGGEAVISGGAVLMTGPNASIVWGTAGGDTKFVYVSGSSSFFTLSGANAGLVTYPYTVYYPSGSTTQFIGGKLNLKLTK